MYKKTSLFCDNADMCANGLNIKNWRLRSANVAKAVSKCSHEVSNMGKTGITSLFQSCEVIRPYVILLIICDTISRLTELRAAETFVGEAPSVILASTIQMPHPPCLHITFVPMETRFWRKKSLRVVDALNSFPAAKRVIYHHERTLHHIHWCLAYYRWDCVHRSFTMFRDWSVSVARTKCSFS